jgi:hypothetical protein
MDMRIIGDHSLLIENEGPMHGISIATYVGQSVGAIWFGYVL